MTTPNQTRIQKITEFAKRRIFEVAANRKEDYIDPEYRWNHTLRVSQYGRQLAEAEGADVELTVAACLLHDMAWFDTVGETEGKDHGRIAARIIIEFHERILAERDLSQPVEM